MKNGFWGILKKIKNIHNRSLILKNQNPIKSRGKLSATNTSSISIKSRLYEGFGDPADSDKMKRWKPSENKKPRQLYNRQGFFKNHIAIYSIAIFFFYLYSSVLEPS